VRLRLGGAGGQRGLGARERKLERVSMCCVRRLGLGRRWRAHGSKQWAAVGAGVDAARAGGVAQTRERYAGQAALKRSSRRGGARAEKD
jgi:hypothetical protein